MPPRPSASVSPRQVTKTRAMGIGKKILAVATILASFATGLLPVPQTAAAAVGTTLCGHNQHLLVHNRAGQSFYIRNVYWQGVGRACIRSTGFATFEVVRTPRGNGKVTTFPNIMAGCIWQICTPRTQMPVRVRRISRLHSTWHTRRGASGVWNSAYDLWFGRHRRAPNGNFSRGGAELMIWINYHGFKTNTHRVVKVAGRLWYLNHWHACDQRIRVCWQAVHFRAVHPRWGVTHINLKRFIARCEHLHLIERRWWLETVGAGFEIWANGRGLGTTRFSVSLRVNSQSG